MPDNHPIRFGIQTGQQNVTWAELVELCRRERVAVMVDEAHAFGVFGEGAGLCDQLKLAPGVDLRIGTSSCPTRPDHAWKDGLCFRL